MRGRTFACMQRRWSCSRVTLLIPRRRVRPLSWRASIARQAAQSAGDRRRDGLPDRRLVVMAALVGRIDASKSVPDGKLCETLRFLLLPSGPVQETGNSNSVDQQSLFGHRRLRLRLAIVSEGKVISLTHAPAWGKTGRSVSPAQLARRRARRGLLTLATFAACCPRRRPGPA